MPKGGFPYFIAGTVIDKDGFRSSTPPRRVERPAGDEKPDYDGCSAWGGFEAGHAKFLQLHGLPVPGLTKDAKGGAQAALLKPGKATFGPVLFTSGLPHRLSLFAKATAKVEVAVSLQGTFDGKPHSVHTSLALGSDWTEATLDFTAPRTLTGSLQIVIATSAGSEVLVDEVQLRPR